MPAYNGQKYLKEAIDSILNQSFKDFEFLIIDDGSTDDSKNIIVAYSDSRIQLIENEQNLGVAASLNKAIEEAKGTYICRMDADDIALPDRLVRQVEYLRANPIVSMCGSWVQAFGELDTVFKYPEDHEAICVALFFYPCFCHPAVMWRKNDFIEHGLWYQEDPPTAEDYDLWARASLKLKLANIPEILLKYRIDMGVKHSPYLIQQTEGNWMVKQSFFRLLGLEYDPDFREMFLNFCGVEIEHSSNRTQLVNFLKFISSMSQANQRRCLYSQTLFDNYLRGNLYGFFVRSKRLTFSDWFNVRLVSEKFPPLLFTMKLFLKRVLK